jgi:hydroxyacylglutathione hydrolase
MTTLPHHALTVVAVPAFRDNYLWLVHDGSKAAVIDPGDAAPILAALEARKLSLTAILLTHHHADHIGGVPALLRHADVPVYGPRADGIAAVQVPLAEGDRVRVPGLDLAFRVLDVPGHTLGHIAYVREGGGEPWLFCGDTLFAGGCGRLFEGTPAQMAASLAKLAALPDDTRVFCAHEYTLSNLRFAEAVEPVPTTIGLEKASNPFLRSGEAEIIATLQREGRLAPGASPFAALREWKNTF